MMGRRKYTGDPLMDILGFESSPNTQESDDI